MSVATQPPVSAPVGTPGDADKPNRLLGLLELPSVGALFLWMIVPLALTGVLVPIYLIFKQCGLLDNIFGLIIIYTLMNLPIAVWMSYTYFCEIPAAILEAGRIDGATSGRRFGTFCAR